MLKLRERLDTADDQQAAGIRARLVEMSAAIRSQKLGEVAGEFDQIRSIHRALAVDRIIPAMELRPDLIDAIDGYSPPLTPTPAVRMDRDRRPDRGQCPPGRATLDAITS